MFVATDVAARGIDVDITHVVNYQLPDEIETIITVLVVLVVLVLGIYRNCN
jgi:hypothetical protein